MERGHCLVSQQIRRKIVSGDIKISTKTPKRNKTGKFEDPELEKRVQPSSFEPVIGNELFVLDIESQAVFNPGPNQQVYPALLQLPKRQRQRVDITGGFELKRGFTYLIPLQEKVRLRKGERLKSSPKSSIGRVFPITRMVADYSSSFDEIHYITSRNRELDMFLLVQPTAFNLIAHPGIPLNQLRFFKGSDTSLSESELKEVFNQHPIMKTRQRGKLRKHQPVITSEGVQVCLDLSGENTKGISALRARRNPEPVDLAQTADHNPEDYFEPVIPTRGEVRLHGGEYYLASSHGILDIPANLSAELRRHSGLGVRGTWDEAGFIDNGFTGDLVFEFNLTETGGVVLPARFPKPVSFLDFSRSSEPPDKTYGKNIGSNYQGQLGPRPSKHFRPFDYARAAKQYKKLDTDVLVLDSRTLQHLRKSSDGFEPLTEREASELLNLIHEQGFFHSRYDCEDDEEVQQIIPYGVIFDKENRVFTYVRASNIADYGDERLFGKHSIGIGGHIGRIDGPEYVENNLQRKVLTGEVCGDFSNSRLIGTMMSRATPVDRVHFGLIYHINVNGKVTVTDPALSSLGMKTIEEVQSNSAFFETWSKNLIPFLPLLKKQL